MCSTHGAFAVAVDGLRTATRWTGRGRGLSWQGAGDADGPRRKYLIKACLSFRRGVRRLYPRHVAMMKQVISRAEYRFSGVGKSDLKCLKIDAISSGEKKSSGFMAYGPFDHGSHLSR